MFNSILEGDTIQMVVKVPIVYALALVDRAKSHLSKYLPAQGLFNKTANLDCSLDYSMLKKPILVVGTIEDQEDKRLIDSEITLRADDTAGISLYIQNYAGHKCVPAQDLPDNTKICDYVVVVTND